MKYKYIIPIIASSLMILSSCDDNLMEWEKDPEHGAVTGAELPLELVEKISRYEPLKTYTNFVLGNGIGADLYISDAAYRKLVNENFDEVTPGYAMKHGAMVNSKGEINFKTIDDFITATKAGGLKVFGHTLVWHSNQNASYLNSIIAPTVIPGSSGTNTLDVAGLKAGTFANWARNNPGKGITIVANAGLTSTSQAIQLASSATSVQPYSLQLTSPNTAIVAGHNYEISFYIKSDVAGKGRLSFGSTLTNQYPYKDWYNTGGSWVEAFATTSQWQQVKIKLAPGDFKAGSTNFQFNLDLGYLPNVTYLIDVNTIAVVDLDAPSGVVNLVANGTFNSGITGWSKANGADNALSLAPATNAYEGSGAMKVINATDNPGLQYKTQIQTVFTTPLTAGKNYTTSFMIRSEAPGSMRCSTTPGSLANYQGDQTTSATWKLIEWKITAKGGETGLSLDLGLLAGTYYIDNVTVTDGSASGGGATAPVTIDKTAAEKTIIIGNAMQDWISKMMTHYKTSVFSWDVVNEPMREDGTMRNGTEGDTATDYFSWVQYLGKDYAVTAFKLARQYGNSTDKLFINDYNLESSLSKCDGLIEYVKYIESKGATVDGIGTQMHISLTTDKDKIVQMFQKLAASGKLIKISELDIRLGTNAPTVAQQASQAEMYQYVIDMYKKYIPAAQQYGVTIWGLSDSVKEHENWLPNESPNLWDANYVRKHAYKGTADGLAGKDVSKDFSGELVKK
ncbi:Carbohydrate binding domain-containing protein [Flavobacterium aquidurense]|uniref:endo-1,4-beta-xylanase n=1 Tax=Flavobacterium frigidimaris TaxID=262320 RepID=A0ABX4BUP1_FLAFR|nr:endo-1,4-beta-xylanase [Flavobacterium frigidimaris]OXA80940.1 glycosyl hydrolase family 10 [Flavobacterium frigidimaris]SDY49146.1 Carbohydrate binding domain-containing protein [Flavobacterium aquidurense]